MHPALMRSAAIGFDLRNRSGYNHSGSVTAMGGTSAYKV